MSARNSLVTLALVLTGCVGALSASEDADESLCAQAVAHLAACGITNLPDPGVCNAAKREIAREVLAGDCAALGDRSTFSSCSGFWSLFNPSCWIGRLGEKLGAGERCTIPSECESGSCVYYSTKGYRCAADPLKRLGQYCDSMDHCESGTECAYGRCRAYSGEWCDFNRDCISNTCTSSTCE